MDFLAHQAVNGVTGGTIDNNAAPGPDNTQVLAVLPKGWGKPDNQEPMAFAIKVGKYEQHDEIELDDAVLELYDMVCGKKFIVID